MDAYFTSLAVLMFWLPSLLAVLYHHQSCSLSIYSFCFGVVSLLSLFITCCSLWEDEEEIDASLELEVVPSLVVSEARMFNVLLT